MEIITLREEYIKLGQALKAAGLVDSGVEAKYAVEEGKVLLKACILEEYITYQHFILNSYGVF